jgi:hypothetical protein
MMDVVRVFESARSARADSSQREEFYQKMLIDRSRRFRGR